MNLGFIKKNCSNHARLYCKWCFGLLKKAQIADFLKTILPRTKTPILSDVNIPQSLIFVF